jgi:hypothetical protein
MSTHSTADTSAPQEAQDYQDRDINVTNIAISLVVIVVVTIASAVGMLALFRSYAGAYEKQQQEVPAMAKVRELPPGPRLQVNGRAELNEYRSGIQATLHSYEYTDKMRGIGRIPVDRAMALLSQQGLPVRKAP